MEIKGVEPLTSCLQGRRSSNWTIAPYHEALRSANRTFVDYWNFCFSNSASYVDTNPLGIALTVVQVPRAKLVRSDINEVASSPEKDIRFFPTLWFSRYYCEVAEQHFGFTICSFTALVFISFFIFYIYYNIFFYKNQKRKFI